MAYVLKIASRQSWHTCLIQRQIALFFMSGLKDKKLIKTANLHENWNMRTLF